ncbi:MAG: hypothetical protein OHK0038_01460 [Flammeovirgaceae bacterium]
MNNVVKLSTIHDICFRLTISITVYEILIQLITRYMKKTVLLIDDDEVFRYIVKRVIELKTPHVELIPTDSCRAALQVLEELQNGNNSTKPDIILLDLDMPVMNGFEFLDTYESRLRQINPNIKIYIVSTSLSSEEHQKAISYDSVAAFLPKPIAPETMETVFND